MCHGQPVRPHWMSRSMVKLPSLSISRFRSRSGPSQVFCVVSLMPPKSRVNILSKMVQQQSVGPKQAHNEQNGKGTLCLDLHFRTICEPDLRVLMFRQNKMFCKFGAIIVKVQVQGAKYQQFSSIFSTSFGVCYPIFKYASWQKFEIRQQFEQEKVFIFSPHGQIDPHGALSQQCHNTVTTLSQHCHSQ